MAEVDTTRSIGDYYILAALSSGGMGRVYLARRRGAHGFEKLLAIKTLLPDQATCTDAREMFLDEARLVSRLSHPTIAQVYDFGEDHGTLYLVMEFVEGLPLSVLLARPEPVLPVGAACRLIDEVCRGILSAHELTDRSGSRLGIVHRDVSPQNILLTFDGRTKIIDFGIALARERLAAATQIGQIKGKPCYMAPEQLELGQTDRRVDVWAVSVVLWELLTRRKLFAKDSVASTITAVLRQPIDPPSKINPDTPRLLDRVVLRGLSRDPLLRHQNALELAYDLERIAATRPSETTERFAGQLSEDRTAQHELLKTVLEQTPSPLSVGARGHADDIPTVSLNKPHEGATGATLQLGPSVDEGPLAATNELRDNLRGQTWWRAGLALVLLLGTAVALLRILGVNDSSGVGADASLAAVVTDLGQRERDAATSDASLREDSTEDARDTTADKRGPRPSRLQPRRPKRLGAPQQKRATPSTRQSPSVVEHGTLSVYADPYAQVRVDGRFVGNTPLRRRRLAVGEHLVVLIDPGSDRIRLRRTVRIEADQNSQIKLPAVGGSR